MEKYELDAIKQRFAEEQAKREAKTRRGGRVSKILDRISPPLQIEPPGSGSPDIAVYRGEVDGIGRIMQVIDNQRTGRPLNEGLPTHDL